MRLVDSTLPEVRGKVYELAKQRGLRNLYENALEELRSSRFGDDAPVVKPAVEYALWVSSDTPDLAKRLLSHPNQLVARSALSALAGHPEAAEPLITPSGYPERRHRTKGSANHGGDCDRGARRLGTKGAP